MKKTILTILMALIAVTVFAYEPKVECFKVFTDSVHYSEKVKVEEGTFRSESWEKVFSDILRFETIEYDELEYKAESLYLELKKYRNDIKYIAAKIALRKKYGLKEYDYQYDFLEDTVTDAVLTIPFVTKENFHKLTKKEYKKIFIEYMRNLVKKESKQQ